MRKFETNIDVNGTITATGGNSANWNTAYTNVGKAKINGEATFHELSPTFFKSNSSYITPITTGLIGIGNILPPTSEAVHMALSYYLTKPAYTGELQGWRDGTWEAITIPLAANGVRGGLQIKGTTPAAGCVPVQLYNESPYVSLSKSAMEYNLTGELTSHTHPLAANGVRGGIQINGNTPAAGCLPVSLYNESPYISMTKAVVEYVLTGTITSHTHSQTALESALKITTAATATGTAGTLNSTLNQNGRYTFNAAGVYSLTNLVDGREGDFELTCTAASPITVGIDVGSTSGFTMRVTPAIYASTDATYRKRINMTPSQSSLYHYKVMGTVVYIWMQGTTTWN